MLQSTVCAALGLAACQEPSLRLLQSRGAQERELSGCQGQVTNGCPLCGLCAPAGFAVQLGSAEVGACLLASARQGEDAVTSHPAGLSQAVGQCDVCTTRVESQCKNGARLWRGSQLPLAPLTGALILANEPPSHRVLMLFTLALVPGLHGSETTSPFAHKPHRFSKPDLSGAHLSAAGPTGWCSWHGARTPRSSRRKPVIIRSLPVVDLCAGAGFLLSPCLGPSDPPQCGLLILCRGGAGEPAFRASSEGGVPRGCRFGVPVGGGGFFPHHHVPTQL